MKNLVFLTISFFCFCTYISCGDENFEAYSDEGYDKSKGLLPHEFTQVTTDADTGTQTTVKTVLGYDNKNRLIFAKTSTSGVVTISQYITYNESNGNVNTVKTILSSSTTLYTYEYSDQNTILEYVSLNGVDTQTNTLSFDSDYVTQPRLLSKNDPNNGVTDFGYDTSGNLTKEGANTYTYDTTLGIMNKVKTPFWLFNVMEGSLPFSYNLINNVITDEEGSSYVYSDYTYSQYPQKITINDDEEITIKYMLAK